MCCRQRSTLDLQHQMISIHAKFGGLTDWMTKIEKHLKEESKAQLQDHSQLFASISSLNGNILSIGAEASMGRSKEKLQFSSHHFHSEEVTTKTMMMMMMMMMMMINDDDQ